jgi:biliverdin reductase
MYKFEPPLAHQILRVGLIGTGYAAKLRAQALQQDPRTHLVGISGHTRDKTAALAQAYQMEIIDSWQELVAREDIDLVVICTINSEHGNITHAALNHNKHVIVEYPLSLDVKQAEKLIALAKTKQKLLHVEHIEVLGGWYQTLKQNIDQLGHLFYVRQSTVKPEHPAPRKWTYHHEQFGFPFMAALSRLHRLTSLLGEVFSVNCHQRYWETETNYYQTCICVAQLCFQNGLLAQVIYGKGETLWQPERKLEISGEQGGLIIDGNQAILIQAEKTTVIDIGTRRGLFAQDTTMVLDHLFQGTPLYVKPEQSLYTLKVADAARRSAETGLTIFLTPEQF